MVVVCRFLSLLFIFFFAHSYITISLFGLLLIAVVGCKYDENSIERICNVFVAYMYIVNRHTIILVTRLSILTYTL